MISIVFDQFQKCAVLNAKYVTVPRPPQCLRSCTSIEKLVEKSAEKLAEKSAEKSTEKSAEKSAEKSFEKSAEKSFEKSAEKDN